MEKYRLLYDILKTINYSKTISEVANRLYMSQPYVSKIIKEYEVKLGIQIVNRKTSPITLTDIGQKLMDDIQNIIAAEDKMLLDIKSHMAHEDIPIVIYVMNPFLLQSVIEAIAVLKNTNNQKYTIIDSIDGSLSQAFKNGIVDIVVGKRYQDKAIELIEIPSPKLCLFSFETCPNFIPGTLYIPFNEDNLAVLNERTFIANFGNEHFNRFINDTFKNMGIALKNEIIVPSVTDALIAMTRIYASTTLTTYQTAISIFSKERFNLMPLPKKLINLDDTIMYYKLASDDVIGVVEHLRVFLSKYDDNCEIV